MSPSTTTLMSSPRPDLTTRFPGMRTKWATKLPAELTPERARCVKPSLTQTTIPASIPFGFVSAGRPFG